MPGHRFPCIDSEREVLPYWLASQRAASMSCACAMAPDLLGWEGTDPSPAKAGGLVHINNQSVLMEDMQTILNFFIAWFAAGGMGGKPEAAVCRQRSQAQVLECEKIVLNCS